MSKTLEFKVFCFEAYRADKNLQAEKQWPCSKNTEYLII